MEGDLSAIGVATVAVVVIGAAWFVLRLVPSVEDPRPSRREYSREEVTEHDRSLPKYALGSALLLALASSYLLITSLSSIYGWAWGIGPDWRAVREQVAAQILQSSGILACMGLAWYWAPRASARPLVARWMATLAFWLVLLGSVGFFVGLAVLWLWSSTVAQAPGMDYAAARDVLGPWATLPPLALPASATILGYLFAAANLILTVRSRPTSAAVRKSPLYPFLGAAGAATLASGVLYVEATLGNPAQLELQQSMAAASACAVLLAIALMMKAGRPFLPQATPSPASWRALWLGLAAVALGWVASMGRSVSPVGTMSLAGGVEMVGSFLLTGSAAVLTRMVWKTTRDYRLASWSEFRHGMQRYDAPRANVRRHVPPSMAIAVEAIGALAGFPGFGWLLNGRGLIGLTLALVGPAISSAVIPTLASPYGEGPLVNYGLSAIFAYLLISASLSASVLALTILREERHLTREKRIGEGG